MTAEEFATFVRAVEGYWPRTEFKDDTLDVWWEQMTGWRGELLMAALPSLVREFNWTPTLAQFAAGYSIEVRKATPRDHSPKHLHQLPDPETRDRWHRVIRLQIAAAQDADIRKATRRHYRTDGCAVVVMDGAKMLADAEQALAESAFGQEDG